jgi:multidrug resistance efflux pump
MLGPLISTGIALARAAKNLKEKSDERQEQDSAQSNYDASRLDARAVTQNLKRAWTLKQQGLFSDDEFNNEKNKTLHDIAVKPVLQDTQDFLIELASLLQEGILTPDDLQKAKRCLEAKFIR